MRDPSGLDAFGYDVVAAVLGNRRSSINYWLELNTADSPWISNVVIRTHIASDGSDGIGQHSKLLHASFTDPRRAFWHDDEA